MRSYSLLSALFAVFVGSQMFTVAANASNVCRDVTGGPDSGYSVTLDGASARVEEITIAGPHLVATLVCHSVQTEPRCCDIPRLELICVEPELRDAGYSFSVSVGGFAGLETGVLSSVSIAGSKEIARTICR